MDIILVEDDEKQVVQIKNLLSKYQDETGVSCNLTHYSSAELFLTEYRFQYDLVLMDIQLQGGMDGLHAAEKMREKDASVCLIFVTDLARFAIEGYKYEALDYFVKPVSYMHFKLRLDQVQRKTLLKKHNEKSIIITFNGIPRSCAIKDIYYIESQGHTFILHTKEGDFPSREKAMKDWARELYSYDFRQCNSGILVNLRYCSGICENTVCLLDERLPISRSKKKWFVDELANYFFNKTGRG